MDNCYADIWPCNQVFIFKGIIFSHEVDDRMMIVVADIYYCAVRRAVIINCADYGKWVGADVTLNLLIFMHVHKLIKLRLQVVVQEIAVPMHATMCA